MSSENILEIQENKLKEILENNKSTLYGKKYNFDKIKTIQDFQKEVPLTKYENYLPYIEKIKMGEEHILTYEKGNDLVCITSLKVENLKEKTLKILFT